MKQMEMLNMIGCDNCHSFDNIIRVYKYKDSRNQETNTYLCVKCLVKNVYEKVGGVTQCGKK